MDQNISLPVPDQPRTFAADDTRLTRALLAAGAVAGPLFTCVVLGQLLTRDGFDLRYQPVSLLSLGDLGWIQVTNFVAAGVLSLSLSVGMRRVLVGGTAGTWGPILVGLFGCGLVLGGVALPDPGLGYPPGTPDTIPDELSRHGALHAVAPPLAFLSLIAACFVLARRFVGQRRLVWAVYSATTGVAALLLSAWPSLDGSSVRLAVASLVGFGWTTAIALHLRRELPVRTVRRCPRSTAPGWRR